MWRSYNYYKSIANKLRCHGGGPYCPGETFPQVEIELEGTGPNGILNYTDGTTTSNCYRAKQQVRILLHLVHDGAYSMVSLTDATGLAQQLL